MLLTGAGISGGFTQGHEVGELPRQKGHDSDDSDDSGEWLRAQNKKNRPSLSTCLSV